MSEINMHANKPTRIEDNTETFSLIDGVFTVEEALELFKDLFSTKIQFHESRNFSALERFGYQHAKDQDRIAALKLAYEEIRKLLEKAESERKHLSVSADIKVNIV